MITDEAVELALAKFWKGDGTDQTQFGRMRAALEAAAAQQEPVAWLRLETQVHPAVPARRDASLDAELAKIWEGHPSAESITPLYASPPPPPKAVRVKELPDRNSKQYEAAQETFAEYFRRNYPGPDTIIFKPDWHAPKLFAAAVGALRAALEDQP